MLVPMLAGVLLVSGLLLCLPGPGMRVVLFGYALLVVLGLGALIAYAARALLAVAWHDHPGIVRGVALAIVGGTAFALLRRLEGSSPSAEDPEADDDQGGGGGGTRRKPVVPQLPPAPCGPTLDWDAFDEARRGWERTPVPA